MKASPLNPGKSKVLTEALSVWALINIFLHPERYPNRLMILSHRFDTSILDIIESLRRHDGIGAFAAQIVDLLLDQSRDWATCWRPWEKLVNAGFFHAPGADIFIQAALLSTAVDESYAIEVEPAYDLDDEEDATKEGNDRSAADVPDSGVETDERQDEVMGDIDPPPSWSDDGFAPTLGLVKRLQVARTEANNLRWWADRLDDLGNGTKRLIGIATVCLWASPSVIEKYQITINAALDELGDEDWSSLVKWINAASQVTGQIAQQFAEAWFEGKPDLGMRLSFALVNRLPRDEDNSEMRRSIGRNLFKSYDGQDSHILREAARLEIMNGAEENVDWDYVSGFSKMARRLNMPTLAPLSGRQNFPVPANVAKIILVECDRHCSQWVAICEQAYQTEIAKNAPKVSEIAEADRWFLDE